MTLPRLPLTIDAATYDFSDLLLDIGLTPDPIYVGLGSVGLLLAALTIIRELIRWSRR